MERPTLNRVWASASSTTRRDPGDTKYIQGWVSEIPTYQVLNYLQYKTDLALLSLAERGFFEWGSDVKYGSGSVVWDETTKKIYVSIVGSPDQSIAPSKNPSHWAESSIQIPRYNYDAAVKAINEHIADVTGNPHKLTAGRLNAYNKAEIDAIVVTYRQMVQDHATDKGNPHKVTALQVGAVPSTGGTYTGPVTFNSDVYFDSGKVNKLNKSGGLFLQTGNFILGINSSGVAVAGTPSSQVPIVTENTFASIKASTEVNYTVPEPSFKMNLIRSIHIQAGTGIMDASWAPSYSPSLGALILPSDATRTLICNKSQIDASSTTWTMAVDVAFSGSLPAIPSDANIGVSINIEGKGAINIRNNGKVYANLASGATSEVSLGNMTSWCRLVMVAAGTNLLLYVNGVLAANISNGVQGTSGGKPYLRTYANSNPRQAWIRNWRIWQSDSLSAAKVSTL